MAKTINVQTILHKLTSTPSGEALALGADAPGKSSEAKDKKSKLMNDTVGILKVRNWLNNASKAKRKAENVYNIINVDGVAQIHCHFEKNMKFTQSHITRIIEGVVEHFSKILTVPIVIFSGFQYDNNNVIVISHCAHPNDDTASYEDVYGKPQNTFTLQKWACFMQKWTGVQGSSYSDQEKHGQYLILFLFNEKGYHNATSSETSCFQWAVIDNVSIIMSHKKKSNQMSQQTISYIHAIPYMKANVKNATVVTNSNTPTMVESTPPDKLDNALDQTMEFECDTMMLILDENTLKVFTMPVRRNNLAAEDPTNESETELLMKIIRCNKRMVLQSDSEDDEFSDHRVKGKQLVKRVRLYIDDKAMADGYGKDFDTVSEEENLDWDDKYDSSFINDGPVDKDDTGALPGYGSSGDKWDFGGPVEGNSFASDQSYKEVDEQLGDYAFHSGDDDPDGSMKVGLDRGENEGELNDGLTAMDLDFGDNVAQIYPKAKTHKQLSEIELESTDDGNERAMRHSVDNRCMAIDLDIGSTEDVVKNESKEHNRFSLLDPDFGEDEGQSGNEAMVNELSTALNADMGGSSYKTISKIDQETTTELQSSFYVDQMKRLELPTACILEEYVHLSNCWDIYLDLELPAISAIPWAIWKTIPSLWSDEQRCGILDTLDWLKETP
ncbi:hypothetical protein C8Q75DRAFT_729987 [Abortiporus biennis]|nr:hypothetical protein C8Q75DRAFT_729987 [Abortiporus biennis]